MNETPVIQIVEARFYEDIADELVKGAVQVLEQAGQPYERVSVPGVFEIPAAVHFSIRALEVHSISRRFAGFIALGCVIRGETSHYDYVCSESARSLMDLSIRNSIALGFGILTCENYDQAWTRAAVDQKNKGGDAARACLRMIEIKKDLRLTTQ
ncbi:MAG: 6,7-dimethyl-8-ribityllumazine synthase [Rhodospirillales bacterium]|nr:6,7-dimethyl-8-ribityllumazine synthase [Rhodospirillales bacterium]